MTKDLTHRLAIHPMVEEADAVGFVAAAYGRILSRPVAHAAGAEPVQIVRGLSRVSRAGVAAG